MFLIIHQHFLLYRTVYMCLSHPAEDIVLYGNRNFWTIYLSRWTVFKDNLRPSCEHVASNVTIEEHDVSNGVEWDHTCFQQFRLVYLFSGTVSLKHEASLICCLLWRGQCNDISIISSLCLSFLWVHFLPYSVAETRCHFSLLWPRVTTRISETWTGYRLLMRVQGLYSQWETVSRLYDFLSHYSPLTHLNQIPLPSEAVSLAAFDKAFTYFSRAFSTM